MAILTALFLLIAVACFTAAAFGAAVRRLNLGWLGLAFAFLPALISAADAVL